MVRPLSATQKKVLESIRQRGGEVNRYAAQPGLDLRSMEALIRLGLLKRVPPCAVCANDGTHWHVGGGCERQLNQRGGERCYRRVRITEQ